VKVGFRQSKKLAKSARMLDDAENLARRAVTAQATFAPIAPSTREIYLPYNTTPEEAKIVGGNHFPDELVSRSAGESIVSPQKLEIRVADAGLKEPNDRIA
jgi:hypothetical protein